MKDRNICKHITIPNNDKLETYRFIFESNRETMQQTYIAGHHRLMLIGSGKGSIVLGESTIPFSAGNLIFIFRDETFYIVPDEVCEYMYIDFDGQRAEILFRRFGINKNTRLFQGYESLIPLWRDSLSRASENNIDLSAESVLLYSFSRLSGEAAESRILLNKIIDHIEQNFSDTTLSLSQIGEKMSYNPSYLSFLFKKQMGVGFSEYLSNYRINYAISLINHGLDSMKNIAFLSGFSDQLYFSTVFKKSVGISPSEYRKKLKIKD